MDEDNLTEVPRARTGRPRVDEGAVMTFFEIGRELGISEQAAHQVFKIGMNKLRERPVLLARLRTLAEELERIRSGQG